MNELKMSIKTKNFVINPLILKSIKRLEIGMNELLILMYFINIKTVLDIEDIKTYYDMTDEEILNTFNSLINKKLIEIVMIKNKNHVDEEISLEILYNKILLNVTDNVKNNTDIYSKFENEFSRTLSPIEYETITGWLDKGTSEETILSALKEAVINGVTNLRYIDKIIYEWNKKAVKETNLEHTMDYKELFDYDWLGDKDE